MIASLAREGKPSLALLAAVTALAFSALHMVVPALPILTAAFDDTPSRVQLVVTLFLAGIAAGQLFYGPISDRFGRRPVLIAGLVLFLAGTLLCGAAWSLPVLIVGRVLQALGACAGIVLGPRDHPRRLRARGGGARAGDRHDDDDAGAGRLAGDRRLSRRMDRLAGDLRGARRARRRRAGA